VLFEIIRAFSVRCLLVAQTYNIGLRLVEVLTLWLCKFVWSS